MTKKYSKSLTRSLAIATVAIAAIAVQAEDTEKAQSSSRRRRAGRHPANLEAPWINNRSSITRGR